MERINADVSDFAKQMGKRGGMATSKLLGREHYVVMQRKSAETRRKKKISTTQIVKR